jgi:serine protease inhibitor
MKTKYWIIAGFACLIVLGLFGFLAYPRNPATAQEEALPGSLDVSQASQSEVAVGESLVASSIQNDDAANSVIAANNRFGFKIFTELAEQRPNQNLSLSPLGLATALTLAYNGAGGETQAAMAETLDYQNLRLEEVNQFNAKLLESLSDLDPEIRFSMANSLWVKQGVTLVPDYVERVKDFYGAEIAFLDFCDPDTPEIINAWARAQTQDRIDAVVGEIDRDVFLYLVNALTFKGNWAIPFDTDQTSQKPFTLTSGEPVSAWMMMTESEEIPYYRGEGFQAVALPYGDGRVRMYLFLPNESSNLTSFTQQLSPENWEAWMSAFEPQEVFLMLPRFQIEVDLLLDETLKDLGMEVAFGQGADFTNLVTPGPGFISQVVHKTVIQVDETGTEGASAAVVEFKKGGAAQMVFDRPFFYAIRDQRTGSLLFVGSILEP